MFGKELKFYQILVAKGDALLKAMVPKLPIDNYDLETVCSEHSADFFSTCTVFAEVNAFSKQFSIKIKEIESLVCHDIRRDPDKFGLSKTTEATVQETMRNSSIVIDGYELKRKVDVLNTSMQSLVTAFEHRRSMINNLVQIRLSGLGEAGTTARKERFEEAKKQPAKPKIIRRTVRAKS